jgi:hypothetical protein
LKGRFRKQRELVREISIVDVESFGREGNELSVSSRDVTSYFVVDKAEPVDALFENIKGSFKGNEAKVAIVEEPELKLTSGTIKRMPQPKKPKVGRLYLKVSRKELGTGILEFKDSFVRFYVEKGLVQKQKETKKEISIDVVDGVRFEENNLTIAMQGTSEVFEVQKGESADFLLEKLKAALDEKHKTLEAEENAKRLQQRLIKTIIGVNSIADDLFEVLIGLHGRIEWDNIRIHINNAQGSFDSLAKEELIKTDLGIGKNILIGKGHKTQEISGSIFLDLKSMYDCMNSLTPENGPADKMHPNNEDARIAVRANYTMNDIILGQVVGDKEIGKETNELFSMLGEISKQTGQTANVDSLKEVINKLLTQDPTDAYIQECRSVFKQQLKQLLNL